MEQIKCGTQSTTEDVASLWQSPAIATVSVQCLAWCGVLMLQNGRLGNTAIQISNIIRSNLLFVWHLSLCQSREEPHVGFMYKVGERAGL